MPRVGQYPIIGAQYSSRAAIPTQCCPKITHSPLKTKAFTHSFSAFTAEAGARFPLVEAGFTKSGVRRWSRQLGLRTWDKPAAACLASRVPYGTPVTLGTLRSVTEAESGLRQLGFRQLRVRHYGDTARIEVPAEDLAAVVTRRAEVSAAVHRAGYRYVTLDLDGFRTGNLNQALGAGSVTVRGADLTPEPDPLPISGTGSRP